MSKETFKEFVKQRPMLAKAVNSKQATWQQFYEMFELYGENSEVWKDYIKKTAETTSNIGFKEVFNVLKKMDMNEVQKGIGSVQKGIEFVQGLIGDKAKTSTDVREKAYEPRPLYKYFDD